MPKRSQQNITNRAAEAAGPGILWDRDVPGFGLRCGEAARVWVLKYRNLAGVQRWHRIGSFPAMTTEQARKIARGLRAAVEQGRDPAAEKEQEREAARAAQAAAVGRLLLDYAAALPGRPSLRGSGAISERHAMSELGNARLAVERMGVADKPVTTIGAADLQRLLRKEASRPATARQLFGAFSRFLDWCRDEGVMQANPCESIAKAKRPKPPPPRVRVVPLPELARLWEAAAVLTDTPRDLARVLIAVPVRRGEAAAMDWADLDLDGGVWILPGRITKNGDPHRIALPALILPVLRARHEATGCPRGGLVFPASRTGGEVSGWTQMKGRLSAGAGFAAWTWHDFRRSFASLMAERGVAEPVADAVLNHRQSGTRGGVLGVYQQARRWPEQQQAIAQWGDALAEAIAEQRRQAEAEAEAAKAAQRSTTTKPRRTATKPTPRATRGKGG